MKTKAIAAALAIVGGTLVAGPAAAQPGPPAPTLLNSEQPGTVVIYPLFDVSGTKKTTLRLSNTSPTDEIDVHLYRVCSAEKSFGGEGFCVYSDRDTDLTPMQTRIFNVRNYFNVDPVNCPTGYVVAYVSDGSTKTAVSNNVLIGSTYIRDTGGGTLRAAGAQAVPVQALRQAGSAVGSGGPFPKLFFDGAHLALLPQQLVTDFRAAKGAGVNKKTSRLALATLDINPGAQNDPTLVAIDANSQDETPVSGSFEYVCHVVTALEEGSDPTKPGPDGFPGGGGLEASSLGSQFGKLEVRTAEDEGIVGQIEEMENNRSTLRNLYHEVDCEALRAKGAQQPKECAKIVFVTSTTQNADLRGLAGGDAICNARAAAADLPGIYTAWLSTDTVDARDRITDAPYHRTGDATLVALSLSDLTDGSLGSTISNDENGNAVPGDNPVWTGTLATGVMSQENCTNWTVDMGPDQGDTGRPQFANQGWTEGTVASCGFPSRLYCFQK